MDLPYALLSKLSFYSNERLKLIVIFLLKKVHVAIQ